MKDEEIDDVLRDAAGAPPDVRPETLRGIAEAIRPTLSAVRPLPPVWMMTAGVVAVCAAVAALGAARAGLFGFTEMDWLQRGVVYGALALLAVLVGRRFVEEMIPGSLRRMSAGAMGVGTCAVLLAVFGVLFRGYGLEHFVSVGVACLVAGVAHAVPAALLSWLVLRRGLALNPVAAGWAAGMLGGLAGLGMLEMHCPNLEAAHVLVWHTAVVPVSGVLGALVGWVLGRVGGSGVRG